MWHGKQNQGNLRDTGTEFCWIWNFRIIVRISYRVFYTRKIERIQNFNSIDSLTSEMLIFKLILINDICTIYLGRYIITSFCETAVSCWFRTSSVATCGRRWTGFLKMCDTFVNFSFVVRYAWMRCRVLAL